MKQKGKFSLIENMFSQDLREELPINAFLLREKRDYKTTTNIEYVTNTYFNEDLISTGGFHKNISNIL